MNTENQSPRAIALVLFMAVILLLAVGPASAAERTGTYDSRVVAFASFWDEAHQVWLNSLVREARAAKEQGDLPRFQSLAKQLTAHQDELHMQVFSTAPIDHVLTDLGDRLPALMREAGVRRVVSQWDEAALAGVAPADRVDVTDRLVREFNVPEAKLRQLEQMKTVKPLPLERARLMVQQHQL